MEEFPNDKDGQLSAAALPDHIYGDCMGMGMGCCCLQVTKQHSTITAHTHTHTCTYIYTNSLCPLQVTIQACDIDEARFLYDQLAVVGPVIVSI